MEFKLPPRSAKPRTRGTTSVIDFGPDTFGWTGLQGVRDLLDYAAEYVDFAKIYAMNALLVPEPTVRAVVGLYEEAGIHAYSGGILFEYACKTNSFAEMLAHLKKVGIRALEISENYLELDAKTRRHYIASAQREGFDVIYEFGRKNPDSPFSMDDLEALVDEVHSQGIEHVIIEQSEIDMIAAASPGALKDLAGQAWFSTLMIEADPYRFPQQHAQLLKDFGPEVNLANVTAGQALRLEGLRRGIGRAVNYTLLGGERTMTPLIGVSDVEALAEELQQLGFTGYEARVYLELLKVYPATAYEIAKQTGLARANVYNTLATLERKAAVQPVNENPVRYVPVDPRQLLDRIQRKTASRCDSLAELLSAIQAPVSTEFVWALSGDRQIHEKITAIIRQADKHVWIKGAHPLLDAHRGELHEAVARGVSVLIVLFGDARDLELYQFGPSAKAYLHEGSGGKVGLSEWLVTMTRDYEEALTATLGASGHGVSTRSRPVVTLAESLIRHEVYLAEIFSHFATQLEDRFGPALYGLRRKYLPEEQVRELALLTGQSVPDYADSGDAQRSIQAVAAPAEVVSTLTP